MFAEKELATRSMRNQLKNYLRVRRREWGLTQKELAFLLGYMTETAAARFEKQHRRLPAGVALACELIFGRHPRDLFPTLFDHVEDGVARRMYELYQRLSSDKRTSRNEAKLRYLQAALSRITAGTPSNEI